MTEIEEKHVSQFYDANSKSFSNTRHSGWDWIDEFIANLDDHEFYYDIGCGNGRNLRIGKSIGIDNCQNFVDEVNASGKIAIKSDMTHIDLPSNSADAIICIAAFHHLSTEERRIQTLLEMKRLIRPCGKLLLSVWSINQPENRRIQFDKYGDVFVTWTKQNKSFDRYYYIFQIDEIKNLFTQTGWKIIAHNWREGNEVFELVSMS